MQELSSDGLYEIFRRVEEQKQWVLRAVCKWFRDVMDRRLPPRFLSPPKHWVRKNKNYQHQKFLTGILKRHTNWRPVLKLEMQEQYFYAGLVDVANRCGIQELHVVGSDSIAWIVPRKPFFTTLTRLHCDGTSGFIQMTKWMKDCPLEEMTFLSTKAITSEILNASHLADLKCLRMLKLGLRRNSVLTFEVIELPESLRCIQLVAVDEVWTRRFAASAKWIVINLEGLPEHVTDLCIGDNESIMPLEYPMCLLPTIRKRKYGLSSLSVCVSSLEGVFPYTSSGIPFTQFFDHLQHISINVSEATLGSSDVIRMLLNRCKHLKTFNLFCSASPKKVELLPRSFAAKCHDRPFCSLERQDH